MGDGQGMCWVLQGFAAGCSNGSVSIFEREADSRLFRRVWQATVEGLAPGVASMVLTPSEDALLFTTAGHQMLKRKLTGSPQVQLRSLQCLVLSLLMSASRRGTALAGTTRLQRLHARRCKGLLSSQPCPASSAAHVLPCVPQFFRDSAACAASSRKRGCRSCKCWRVENYML